jgi:hypothetical protein
VTKKKSRMAQVPDMPPAGMKWCGRCLKELPQNDDWFDRDATKADGFKNWCKQCRQERNELAKLTEAAEIVKTLDKAMIATLTDSQPGGTTVPHQAEMYQVLMSMMGGVQGWGMHWMAQYISAPAGGQSRERMMGQIQKMAAAVSDSNKVSMPAELMSDEDLEIELKKREERMRVIPTTFTDSSNAKAG